MKERLKVGIVGLGRLGRRHAENLAKRVDRADLVAACSVVPAELDWARGALGLGSVYDDYGEMLERADLDAVFIAIGLGLILTNAYPVPMLRPEFKQIGQGSLGPIPFVVIVFILVAVVAYILLNNTKFGKNVYAIGGNINAARTSGIKVEKNLIFIYAFSGLCASIAGILITARAASGIATLGNNYELDAIAAATIGGTSHAGGIGTVPGIIAGILILGILNNGLLLLGISPYLQQVIKGVIIVVAVIFDMRKNAVRR